MGAIVAAAGGMAWALAKSSKWLLGHACGTSASDVVSACAASASTAGPVFLGLRGWQWLNLGAFAINIISVSIPGRIDGKMAEEAKRAAKIAKEGGGGGGGGGGGKDGVGSGKKKGDDGEEIAGVPRDSMYRSLVTPAGWAFAIWQEPPLTHHELSCNESQALRLFHSGLSTAARSSIPQVEARRESKSSESNETNGIECNRTTRPSGVSSS